MIGNGNVQAGCLKHAPALTHIACIAFISKGSYLKVDYGVRK